MTWHGAAAAQITTITSISLNGVGVGVRGGVRVGRGTLFLNVERANARAEADPSAPIIAK